MGELIHIDDDIHIPVDELDIQAVRAQGAGGQNVNKVASAIHLRYDFRNSQALPDWLCERIDALEDGRVTAGGIVIKAQESRSQRRNREAAIERLRALVQSALHEPPERVPTRPTRASRKKRIEDKRRLGRIKQRRGPVVDDS